MKMTAVIAIDETPPRHGHSWSAPEKDYLVKAARRGDSIERIASLLGRKDTSVLSMLANLGLVKHSHDFPYYWWHYKAGRNDPITFRKQKNERIEMTLMEAKRLYEICTNLE